MSKHTPGPWRLWDADISPGRITDATGEIDALLDCSEDGRGFNRIEDARLAAAAPTMLYFIQRILSELPTKRDWLDPDVERIAREVVANVEGK